MEKLPYDFDLMYDLKLMSEVEAVCRGECPAGTDATPEDLLEMFMLLELEIPECLKSVKKRMDVWICIDGSWITGEPLYDEAHKYVHAKIEMTKEFEDAWKCRRGIH